jgi:N utilization substance protein A
VPPDQLSLAIGREGQNVRLAARLTGWKIDIKNSTEYDQAAEDAVVAELISQREEEEALQQEAEERLAVEQAARAEEDARLRELYPLPEDDEDYVDEAELSDEPSAEFVEGDAVGDVVEEGEGEEAASDSEETGEASADAEVNLSEDAR